jgi:hypothetical protein
MLLVVFQPSLDTEPIEVLYLSIPASRDTIRVFAKRDQNIVIAHRESNEVEV